MAEMSAVASAEPAAAKVPFQRHHGNVPPHKNVNSVASAELAAGQFGGSIAVCAECAAFSAHFAFSEDSPCDIWPDSLHCLEVHHTTFLQSNEFFSRREGS